MSDEPKFPEGSVIYGEPEPEVRIDELGGLGRRAMIPRWVYELLTAGTPITKAVPTEETDNDR